MQYLGYTYTKFLLLFIWNSNLTELPVFFNAKYGNSIPGELLTWGPSPQWPGNDDTEVSAGLSTARTKGGSLFLGVTYINKYYLL